MANNEFNIDDYLPKATTQDNSQSAQTTAFNIDDYLGIQANDVTGLGEKQAVDFATQLANFPNASPVQQYMAFEQYGNQYKDHLTQKGYSGDQIAQMMAEFSKADPRNQTSKFEYYAGDLGNDVMIGTGNLVGDALAAVPESIPVIGSLADQAEKYVKDTTKAWKNAKSARSQIQTYLGNKAEIEARANGASEFSALMANLKENPMQIVSLITEQAPQLLLGGMGKAALTGVNVAGGAGRVRSDIEEAYETTAKENPSQLLQLPEIKDRMANGMSFEEAVNDAKTDVTDNWKSIAAGAVISGTEAFTPLGKFGQGVNRGVLKTLGKEVGQEAFQEGAEQFTSNLAVGEIDGKTRAFDNVIRNSTLGGIAGLGTGIPTAIEAGLNKNNPIQTQAQTSLNDDEQTIQQENIQPEQSNVETAQAEQAVENPQQNANPLDEFALSQALASVDEESHAEFQQRLERDLANGKAESRKSGKYGKFVQNYLNAKYGKTEPDVVKPETQHINPRFVNESINPEMERVVELNERMKKWIKGGKVGKIDDLITSSVTFENEEAKRDFALDMAYQEITAIAQNHHIDPNDGLAMHKWVSDYLANRKQGDDDAKSKRSKQYGKYTPFLTGKANSVEDEVHTQPSVEVGNEADVTNLEPNVETENSQQQTLQNGVRYSLNESNDSDFIRSIEDISSGKRKGRDDRYLNMGTTPDVFKMIGLPDTKVSMRESVIDKVTQGKHKIDIDDFKQLPNQINNPIAVTKSRTRPNGYVVLTELNENVDGVKKPVIAALHLNKTNNGLEVVNIVSSYGRNISQLNEDIKESLYWNKTKGYPFARTVGLQLPSSLASVDNLSAKNIKTETDLSQYQADKNTVLEERHSRSPIKSVEANIKRGREAMEFAINHQTDVANAMYREGLGWVDFIWGTEGKVNPNKDKRKGAKGVSHIIEKRMNVDHLTRDEVVDFLENTVPEIIAKGTVERDYQVGDSRSVAVIHNGSEVHLIKKGNENAWLLTGFMPKNQTVNQSRGATTSDLRTTSPIRSRTDMGASDLNNVQQFTQQRNNQIVQDQATLSRILGEKTASHIQVVDSNTQIPTGQNVKKLAANGVEGWFDVSSQKLYIISDNITANEVLSRDERLAWVAFHELSHAGVRIKFGPILTNVLASAGKNVVVKVLARKIQAEYGYTQEVATEEAMAEIYAAFETGNWAELESRYKVKIHQSYKQGKDSVGDFLTKVANILRRLIGGIVGKDLTKTMTTSQVFETLRGIQQGVNDIANTEQNQTAGGVRYSLNESKDSEFARAVEAIENGDNPASAKITLGTTPDVLKMLGIDDGNVIITARTLRKDMVGKHKVSPEAMKQLPQQLNDPIAVVHSRPDSTNPEAYLMLTELTEVENGKELPVIAALDFVKNKDGDFELVEISSAYGRKNVKVAKDLLYKPYYWNKTKGNHFLKNFSLSSENSELLSELRTSFSSDDYLSARNVKTEADLSQYQAENSVRYSFAGRNAKTANHSLLEQAERDLVSGKNAEEIRKETGWFKGVDGKWRFEIDDSQISFKQNFDETDNALSVLQKSGNSNQPVATVGDILNAPELFAAYPDIAKINVVNSNDDYTAGGYLSDDFISLDSNLPVNKIKSTLLHELQHAIQNREQFAYGGSIDPRFIYALQQELYENVEGSRLALQRLNGKHSVYASFISKGKEAELKRKEFVIYRSVAKLRDYAYAENITRYRKHILDNVNLVHGLLLDIKNGKLSVTDEVRKTLSSIDGKTWNLPNQRSDDFPHALRVLALDTAEAFDSVIRNESRAEFDNDKRAFNTISRALDKAYDAVYDDAENARNVIRNAERQVRKAEALESKYGHHNASPYQIYTAMAGEVEARNVETRMNMTVDERLNRSPESTEDVRRDEQIVRYADGSIANSLNENPNSDFAKAVDDVFNSDNRAIREEWIDLGTTPKPLIEAGIDDLPMFMNKQKIGKIKNEHPEMTADLLKQIPKQLNNPVIIFKNTKKGSPENSYVIFTELLAKNGNPVIAAIHANRVEGGLELNKLASVYGRNEAKDYLANMAKYADVRFVDKQKAREFQDTLQLLAPETLNELFDKASIVKNADESNTRFSRKPQDLSQSATDNNGEFSAENEDIRYSRKQSAMETANAKQVNQHPNAWVRVKNGGFAQFKKEVEKARAFIDTKVHDRLRPVMDWIDGIDVKGLSPYEKSQLKDSIYAAEGIKSDIIVQAELKYLNPIRDDIAVIAKKYFNGDGETALKKAGFWISTRWAIEKNAQMLKADYDAMIEAEQEYNDAVANGEPMNVQDRLERAFIKAENQYYNRKADVESRDFSDDRKYKAGTAGGWSTPLAKAIMAKMESQIPRAELEALAEKVYDLNAWKLDQDLESGRFTAEEVKRFKQDRHYVPLTGDPSMELDDMLRMPSNRNPNVAKDKGMEGRKLSEADDAITTIWESVAKTATYNGWQPMKAHFAKLYDQSYQEAISNGLSQKAAADEATKKTGIAKQKMQGLTRTSDNVLIYKENGNYYELSLPEKAMEQIKKQNSDNTPTPLRPVQAATGWLARGVTQFKLHFAMVNMVRDLWEKSEFVRTKEIFDKNGNPLSEEVKNQIGREIWKQAMGAIAGQNTDVWKAAKRYAMKQGLRDNVPAELELKTLLKNGGVSTHSTFLERKETDLIKTINKRNSSLAKGIEKAIRAVEIYNGIFDIVSSISANRALLKYGVDPKHASAVTLDLTNFRKQGDWMPFIKSFYMFAQPAAIGGANLIKMMGTKTGRTRLLKGALFFGALSFILRSIADEDEDGNAFAKEGDKDRFIPIPIGEYNFKLPVGYGAPQLMWNMGYNITEAIMGDKTWGDAAASTMLHAFKSVAPVSPSEVPVSEYPGTKALMTLTPTIAQPIVQNIVNRNAFGSSLASSFINDKSLKAEQGKMSTAPEWTEAALWLNDTFGMDFAPEHVKNFVQGYANIVPLMNETLTILVENPNKARLGKPESIPSINAVVGPKNPYATQSQFYRFRDEANDTVKNFNSRKERGTLPESWKTDPEIRWQRNWFAKVEEMEKLQRKVKSNLTRLHNEGKLSTEVYQERLNNLAKDTEAKQRKLVGMWRFHNGLNTTATRD